MSDKLSERMLNDGMYPGIVEKWADEVAALEHEAKYWKDAHSVVVEALETRLSKMEEAAIEAEKMFDVMAIEDIKEWLTVPLRQLYAEVHTDLREALAGESDGD